MKEILSSIANWGMTTGIKLVIALVILLVSFKVINALGRKLEKKLTDSQKLDKTLARTLAFVGRTLLKIVIVIALIGYLGFETSGISALIASLGVAAGLAINGALANFAGGVLILVTRPFGIGAYIVAQGEEGVVEEIRVVSTKIVTVDNRVVYLPNGALSSGAITNVTGKDVRRVDLDFSVAGNDPELVKKLVLETAARTEKVLEDPAPFARVTDYGAGNGTKVTLRAWCNTADYWDARFSLLENVKLVFDANEIVIPFNQLDVHVKND